MYRILLADDKEIFCRSVMRMQYFRDNSDKFSINWVAHNGAEARDILMNDNVDLVLTDIKMPIMDGIELLNYIQANKLCPITILLSEYIEFSYAKNAFLNGAFDYLVKPIDNELLSMVLNEAYTFLNQRKGNGLSIFPKNFELLDYILHNDESTIRNKICEIKASSLRNNDIMSSINTSVREMFMNLYTDINLKFPYIKNYVPIEMLCSFDEAEKNQKLIFDDISLRILLVHEKLKKLKAPTNNDLIKNVWYYSIYHIDENPKLMDIASHFFVNRNYLSTLFKSETGMSYKEFLVGIKIERAKLLLCTNTASISGCCEKLGFSDAEYFRKVFKSNTGIAPSHYNFECYLSGK